MDSSGLRGSRFAWRMARDGSNREHHTLVTKIRARSVRRGDQLDRKLNRVSHRFSFHNDLQGTLARC